MLRVVGKFYIQLIFGIALLVARAEAIDVKSVYVVDFEKVITESKAAKEAKAQIEKQVAVKRKELEGKNQKLKSMKAELQRQAAVLSQSVLEEKAEGVKDYEGQLVGELQDFEDSMKSQNARVLDALVDKTKEAITEIGEDQSLGFVLLKQSRSVLYVNQRIDITSKVLKFLEDEDFSIDLD
ncbi:MAG: OmpH family outer membrane protein [Bdellovibrionales bacterium]|nr:OmpH family outer membrane protein [Bdellovibrionales bacterium]